MNMIEILEDKKAGQTHNRSAIDWLIANFTNGNIPDYQMSAWLMAACCRDLNRNETYDLTMAMIESGEVIVFERSLRPLIDKHSTGGVGDKVSLIAIPIIAAAGGRVFKMSGRGLSHTGGTLDKLESIPGYKTGLSIKQAKKCVSMSGAAIISQSAGLVPADKAIYALRDVTATVNNKSLIASSIISKKIAAGTDVMVFDIKVGSGAFMKTIEEARELASLMKYLVRRFGKKAVFILSAMDEPLGYTIGNRVEVAEAISVMRSKIVPGLYELSVAVAAHALSFFKPFKNKDSAVNKVMAILEDGSALEAFYKIVCAHGVKKSDIDALTNPPATKYKKTISSGRDGYIGRMDALAVGEACRDIGAGRLKKDQSIDHEAGIILRKKVGDRIHKGDEIMTLFSNDKAALETAAKKVADTISIRATKPPARPIVLEIL